MSKQCHVVKVCGDGYCLLNSIQTCYLYDVGKVVSIGKMKRLMTQHMVENPDKYTAWHVGDSNTLVEDVTIFFETG